ncbi:MAG: protein kinase, partial [Myxococcota bacterium]
MAPEQILSSRDVDTRTDIWAVGVVLYELLSGRLPFRASSMENLSFQIIAETAPPLAASVPTELADIVARCLHKKPIHRFQHVAELAEALAAHASDPDEALRAARRMTRILGIERGPRGYPGQCPVAEHTGPATVPSAQSTTLVAAFAPDPLGPDRPGQTTSPLVPALTGTVTTRSDGLAMCERTSPT